jgi:transposase-like protein
MTFLNDFLKKLKTEPLKPSDLALHPSQIVKPSTTETILEAFQATEVEDLQSDSIRANLQSLNELINQPKEEKPELRFSQIKQYLGPSECHETVRLERWHPNIHCPKCRSSHLRRLINPTAKSSHNHRYLCLDCETEFNDDSGTPFEKGVPPINTWMQCWYLLGCTDSTQYIAHKLGLDIHIIELMIRQLQKTFNAKKPLTRFSGYNEWSKQAAELRKKLKADLLDQYERLDADVSFVPKDTEEHRRQQIRRRTLSTDTTDPSSGMGKKR